MYTAPWVLQFGYANWSSLSLLFFLNPCHLCLGSFKFGASGRGANWGDNGGGMVGETGRYWGVTVGGCKPAGWQSGRSAHGLHRAWASQVSNQRRQRVAGNLLEFLWISMNKLKGRIHPRIYFCQSPWEHDLWISQVEGRIPVYQSAWGALGRASRIEFVAFACGGTPVFALPDTEHI